MTVAEAFNPGRNELLCLRLPGIALVVRVASTEQFVADAGQGVDVICRICGLTLQHFETRVGRGQCAEASGIKSGCFSARMGFAVMCGACNAEVKNLGLHVLIQNDIARLQI